MTAALFVGALWGCSSAMSPESMELSYQEALAKTQPLAISLSPDVRERTFEQLAELFRDMTAEKTQRMVPSLYAPDAYMNDGLKVLTGAEQIADYLSKAAKDARQLRFDFTDTGVSTGGPDHYIRWVMTMERSGINGGEPLQVPGVSQFRFDRSGRVILHRDFWNTASGFYERIPVLGWLIGRVRARI